MNRRTFLCGLTLGALSGPLAVEAQQAGREPTIGVLATTRLTDAVRQAIRDGLREHGYVEGQNVLIEWRAAEGLSDRAAALATELVGLKVDVIVAFQTPAVQAAKHVTSTIPIVMAPAGDPVGSGLVVSLGRPGRNITGVTSISAELAGKQLEALRQLVPGLRRLALLIIPHSDDPYSKSLTEQTQAAAKTTGIGLHVVSVQKIEEFERAFATMAEHRDEGVIVQGVFTTSFGRIAQLGLRYHLLSISSTKEFAEAGGLLAYGASRTELARRAAFYVARILKGAKPADLPIEQPTKFELAINLKTAKALGLTIPPSLLARADQVLE
jgi:putative tryptophan/tyrosine transport system substrate-binding protein